METQKIEFAKAFYIKLGKGGKWETSSIEENKARIGWSDLTLEEIQSRKWEKIKRHKSYQDKKAGAVTSDINALKHFSESTSDDVWITFHTGCLWWCRLGEAEVKEDEISRYRLLESVWSNKDVAGNVLHITQIPGILSKIQGFRGTICSINNEGKYKELDTLKRLLNNQQSEEAESIERTKKILVNEVQKALPFLYWKDFEILTDLIFSHTGWKRVSLVGEMTEGFDISYEDPITQDKYHVQVKSQASLGEYQEWVSRYTKSDYRKIYFVVHSPKPDLVGHPDHSKEKCEVILPEKLAKMVVDYGLVSWFLNKI